MTTGQSWLRRFADRRRGRPRPPPAHAYFRMDQVEPLLEAVRGLERSSESCERRLAGCEARLDGLAPSAIASAAAAPLFDPTLGSLFHPPARLGAGSAWWMHVPFAQWIVPAAMPGVLVELGTYNGVSYSAFCQAVVDGGLATRCHAVDTWRGDRHAGEYGDEVYEDFRRFHDAHYAHFSTLLRMTFDEGLGWFSDGSVDFLHIDGLHTYEAVKHDFESWRPKLSDRAVALFHDINVRWEDFGVWRYWDELRGQYPSFEFHFGYGLGILAVGNNVAMPVRDLCALRDQAAIAAFRNRFALIAEHWQKFEELTRLSNALGDARAETDRLRQERDAEHRAAESAQAEVAALRETVGRLETAAAQRVGAANAETAALRQEVAQLKATGAEQPIVAAAPEAARAMASR